MKRRIALMLCSLLALPSIALAQAKDPVKLRVGMVAAVDMLALPIAVERGFFEKYGLDVTIARPYATGVDALNALQAGETDMVQAGVPAIGAILRGMDLVFFGNFSGNATKLGSDATLVMIATSFGTINYLYILGLLEKAGLTPADVTLVNTPPPEMTVALLAKGVDAFVAWDPAPVIGMKDVPGAIEVIRGGDVISYLGFNIGLRPWVEKNGATIEKFLAGVSEADQWMRKNPKQAAAIGTRWIPGLKLDVAETAMQYNIQQVDRRISAHNYRALWKAQDTLQRLGVIKTVFDVNKHIEPKYILNVMQTYPALFSDLQPIPADVAIKPGFVFKP